MSRPFAYGDEAAPVRLQRRARVRSNEPLPPNTMIHDDLGRCLPNVANVMPVLRGVAEVEWCFAFDEMLRVTMLTAPIPAQAGLFARVRDNGRSDVALIGLAGILKNGRVR
jgi:hypothetical protein